MNPLISVIIPVYKVEEYLNKCVESVINQTYINLDIILVDDGSPDNCPDICDSWAEKDERIRVIHKVNAGLGEARNSGMEIATGEYVMFLDSDDWLSLDAVQILYDRMIADGSDLAIGQNVFSYGDGSEKVLYSDWMYDAVLTKAEAIEKMGGKQQLPYFACSKLFKFDIIKNIKFPATHCAEDLYFLIFVMEKCEKVSLVSQVVYHYLQRNDSIMHSGSEAMIYDNVKIILFAAKHYFEKDRYNLASHFFNMAVFKAVAAKDKVRVRKLFSENFTTAQRNGLLEKSIKMYWRYFSLYIPFIYSIVKALKKFRASVNSK